MGGGGAPLRYEYTAGGFSSFQPWNDATFAYSILQLYKGYNPMSKLEVVSLLNIPSQAHHMYYYNYQNCPERHYPKVYLGTLQTIGKNWLREVQTGINYPSIWPEVKPQKGEANIYIKKKQPYGCVCVRWWALKGLNFRPRPYQGRALTN